MLVQAVGKKGSGGSAPVIDELNVTPSTSAQVITAPSGTDGYSPVNVSAVDATIDSNITAGNIKSGVSILGVSGSVVELNGTTASVTPTTSAQTITPTAPNNGFTEISVNAVTSAIDSNIQAGNIKQGVTILGVAGNYSGITPTGTLPITANGVYDVTNYASADVQVPSTAPAYYIEKVNDNGTLKSSANMINLSNITAIGDYALGYAYRGATGLTGAIDLSAITSVGQYGLTYAFADTGISSVDLSGVVNLTGADWSGKDYQYALSNICRGCTSLTSADLSSLEVVGSPYAAQSLFYNCTSLTSVDLSSLVRLRGHYSGAYMFYGCSALTSVSLPKLQEIVGYTLGQSNSAYAAYSMFYNCTSLTTVDLSSLTTIYYGNDCAYMFGNCTNLTTITFTSLDSLFNGGGGSTGPAQYMFTGSGIRHIYFPALYQIGVNPSNMLNGISGCTIHLPSNRTHFTATMFGGSGTIAAYDQPPVYYLNQLNGNGYARSPKYDTATALAWRYGYLSDARSLPPTPENTFYTSGLTAPQVGDNIYSDPECTVVVTQITSRV